MDNNLAKVIVALLTLIAVCSVAVGLWIVYITSVMASHLIYLRIALNDLQIGLIDAVGDDEWDNEDYDEDEGDEEQEMAQWN